MQPAQFNHFRGFNSNHAALFSKLNRFSKNGKEFLKEISHRGFEFTQFTEEERNQLRNFESENKVLKWFSTLNSNEAQVILKLSNKDIDEIREQQENDNLTDIVSQVMEGKEDDEKRALKEAIKTKLKTIDSNTHDALTIAKSLHADLFEKFVTFSKRSDVTKALMNEDLISLFGASTSDPSRFMDNI